MSLLLVFLLELSICLADIIFQCLDLLFVFLNDFLAEVRSPGKLFLYLLMVGQILLEVFDDTFHLMVLQNQVLVLT